MKFKNILLYASFSVLALLSACNDSNDYHSNDPDAAADGSMQYFFYQDLAQDYTMFYRPSHGFVGDPMPFYENGTYHVFYLQDTRPAPATYHPWYKASTQDFMTYVDEGEMIPCGEDNSQEDALGTGSVFKHDNTYYAFYTAHNANIDPNEMIYLATSTDLKNWEKQTAFQFRAPDGFDRNEFRDPFIMKVNNEFKMLISTRADVGGDEWKGVIGQFTSADLLDWTLDPDEPFFYIAPEEYIVECPDVFTEGNYQYLIFSGIASRRVHYRYREVGTSEWITPANDSLDGITYYAAKTAADGTHRYLFGWAPTRTGNNDETEFNWGGDLVAHELKQNSDGTLAVLINSSIDTAVNNQVANGTALNVTASSAPRQSAQTSYSLSGTSDAIDYVSFDRLVGITKIDANFKPSTATQFGLELAAAGNRREIFQIQFDLTSNKLEFNRVLRLNDEIQTIDSVNLPDSKNGVYEVTLLVQNALCVLYVNDQVAFTNRSYFMNGNPWGFYSNNGEVTVSEIAVYN